MTSAREESLSQPQGNSPAWVIGRSDLQRYTYRAIDAVKEFPHRVIFIPIKTVHSLNLKDWVLLCGIQTKRSSIERAIRTFRRGEAVRVKLGELPALRSRS